MPTNSPTKMLATYALVNRPAMIGAVPKVEYTVLPRPAAGQPHHEMARHGIFVPVRALTEEEINAYELALIVDDLDDLVKFCVSEMLEHRTEYLEMATAEPEYFEQIVAQCAQRAHAFRVSIGSRSKLASLVAEQLRTSSVNYFRARSCAHFDPKVDGVLYEVITPEGERVASATNETAANALAGSLNHELRNWVERTGVDAVVNA